MIYHDPVGKLEISKKFILRLTFGSNIRVPQYISTGVFEEWKSCSEGISQRAVYDEI